MSKTAEVLAVRLSILQMMEAGKTVGQIARALNMTRLKVYDEINSAQQHLKVQLDAQIASIVRDTVGTLAAMAEEIRADAEASTDGVPQSAEHLIRRIQTIQMYCQLYDRGMKLIGEYWKRTMPPSLPTPDEVEAQMKLLEEKRDQEYIEGIRDTKTQSGVESSDQESPAIRVATGSDGDGERDGP